MKKIRVLIADDHELIRVGLRLLIENEPGLEVCGEAADGRAAVAVAAQSRPDVVVLDLTMRELNGLEAARQIKQKLPEVEVVFLSGYANEELVHQVFDFGARSYLRKMDASTYLVPAVRAAHAHRPFFTSRADEVLFMQAMRAKPKERATHTVPLTNREREIVQLLAEGASNKEVAKKLRISLRTVEVHRANILRKLDLSGLADLVRYAIRNNITQA